MKFRANLFVVVDVNLSRKIIYDLQDTCTSSNIMFAFGFVRDLRLSKMLRLLK